jgi:hypothetical protein
MIPLWSIPYALITGNTTVLKPSERTPTAAMILADCTAEAGFPRGVLNIVLGGARAVNILLSQPAVLAVSSREVAILLISMGLELCDIWYKCPLSLTIARSLPEGENSAHWTLLPSLPCRAEISVLIGVW